jgi:hypothetical protein
VQNSSSCDSDDGEEYFSGTDLFNEPPPKKTKRKSSNKSMNYNLHGYQLELVLTLDCIPFLYHLHLFLLLMFVLQKMIVNFSVMFLMVVVKHLWSAGFKVLGNKGLECIL